MNLFAWGERIAGWFRRPQLNPKPTYPCALCISCASRDMTATFLRKTSEGYDRFNLKCNTCGEEGIAEVRTLHRPLS